MSNRPPFRVSAGAAGSISVLLPGRPVTPGQHALRIGGAMVLGGVWLPLLRVGLAPRLRRIADQCAVTVATHCLNGDPERFINPTTSRWELGG